MNNDIPRLTPRRIALYSVAAFGGGVFYAFNNFVLPLILPSNNTLLVNLMSNTRSIEGAIVQPVVGAWSDRIWTRLGRRRPFMLVAIPISALAMALTPLAPSLAATVGFIVLFSLLFNVAADPYNALQGDIAPPGQRPYLNAVATVVGFVGQIAFGLFIALGPFGKHIPLLVYPLAAALIAASFLVTVATVRERRQDVHLEPRRPLGEYVVSLRAHRQAMRYLIAMFLFNVGINTIQVNLTRYATRVLGVSDGDAVLLAMILLLITALFTIPAAWVARRLGLKATIMAGMALMAVAACGAIVATTMAQVVPLMVLAGIGNATLTLTWPLLTLLVPQERLGVFAGLGASAGSISALFSGFIAALIVDHWGYRGIFLILLVAIVASLVAFSTIKVARGTAQPLGAPTQL